jgi:hypothetical protein
VTTGLKMLASAVVAAALTAALIFTFWGGPERPNTLTHVRVSDAPEQPAPAEPGGDWDNAARSGSSSDSYGDLPRITGNGVISGTVATADGEGVAGVFIIAQPVPVPSQPGTRSAPPEPDLDSSIRSAIESTHRRVTGTRRATTGADGAYRLAGLGDVGYRLRPYAEHYSVRAARGQKVYGVKPGDTVDFTASQIVAVRVLVEGFDLSSGERITIHRGPDEDYLARSGGSHWSPDRPVLSLPPGKCLLQAVQGRDRMRKSKPVEVTLLFGAPETTVVLRLEERPGLKGTVILDPTLAVTRLEVKALPFTGDQPPDVKDRMVSRKAQRGRYDRRTREYSFPKITPGRYLVWVTFSGERMMGSAVVEIVDRVVTQDIETGVPDAASYVVLHITGPDGEPVDPGKISIGTSYRGGNMHYTGGAGAIPLKDGTWLLAPEPAIGLRDDQKGGTNTFGISHRDLGRREVPYNPKDKRTLECRFEKPIALTVSIRGLERAGLGASASLYLKTSLETNGLSLSGGRARQEGERFVLDKAQPGEWLLVLIHQGEGGFVVVDRLPVTLAEGSDHISWPLPALHNVRVSTADPEKRASLRLIRIDPAGNFLHQSARAEKGKDSVFRLVPPGNYELVGTYDGEERRIPISVPGQTHVVVE